MTLGESIYRLKSLQEKSAFTDYPDLEQIKSIKRILKIIKGLEVPELVGKDEQLQYKLFEYHD